MSNFYEAFASGRRFRFTGLNSDPNGHQLTTGHIWRQRGQNDLSDQTKKSYVERGYFALSVVCSHCGIRVLVSRNMFDAWLIEKTFEEFEEDAKMILMELGITKVFNDEA